MTIGKISAYFTCHIEVWKYGLDRRFEMLVCVFDQIVEVLKAGLSQFMEPNVSQDSEAATNFNLLRPAVSVYIRHWQSLTVFKHRCRLYEEVVRRAHRQ